MRRKDEGRAGRQPWGWGRYGVCAGLLVALVPLAAAQRSETPVPMSTPGSGTAARATWMTEHDAVALAKARAQDLRQLGHAGRERAQSRGVESLSSRVVGAASSWIWRLDNHLKGLPPFAAGPGSDESRPVAAAAKLPPSDDDATDTEDIARVRRAPADEVDGLILELIVAQTAAAEQTFADLVARVPAPVLQDLLDSFGRQARGERAAAVRLQSQAPAPPASP